jgi:predicted acyltransferase
MKAAAGNLLLATGKIGLYNLMIFVNDLWSLTGIPVWLGHARADQDFLGFSDIVFPCFLFIVGMAIPYAIHNRIAKGENHFQILRHIVLHLFSSRSERKSPLVRPG